MISYFLSITSFFLLFSCQSGSLPNSHRKIEPELMRRFMNDFQISNIISSGTDTKGLELLEKRPSVGSLSETDQYDHDEMERFLMYSKDIQESTITGSEKYPGEMLRPYAENVPLSVDDILDLIVKYYNGAYEGLNLRFRKLFSEDSSDSIIIPPKMTKYCRCRIGSEIFGSTFSSRHQKSSYILSKFEAQDGNIDTYPGQIQFFFVHNVAIDGINFVSHYLAYVRWYKPSQNRYYFRTNNEQTCNVELWDTEFYPKGRDCIIPVHHILGRFVPVKYKISDRRNAKELIAVNLINRKYNI